MSIRVDTSSWISGAVVCGHRGLGVLAEDIPSTGDNGGSYLYNDITLPADAGKEICGRITTWPSAGALYAYEDGSFEFTDAPDGQYSFAYQLYVDGVASGTGAVTLQVGASTASIDAVADASVFAGSAFVLPRARIAAAVADAVFAGGVVSIPNSSALVEAIAESPAFSGSAGVSPKVAISVTTADAAFVGSASVAGSAVWPTPEQVLIGVTYGPTGADYTGTAIGGTSSPTAGDIAAAVLAAVKADPSTLTVSKFLGLK